MRFFSFYLIGVHAIFSDVNTIALVSFLCERSATLKRVSVYVDYVIKPNTLIQNMQLDKQLSENTCVVCVLRVCCVRVACMLHVCCMCVACMLRACCVRVACVLHACCMCVAERREWERREWEREWERKGEQKIVINSWNILHLTKESP
jgi:hypothetical protein